MTNQVRATLKVLAGQIWRPGLAFDTPGLAEYVTAHLLKIYCALCSIVKCDKNNSEIEKVLLSIHYFNQHDVLSHDGR